MSSPQDYYPITGIQDGLGPKDDQLREVPLRMEIDEWFKSKETIHMNQQALFFPAFLTFAKTPPLEKLSWFQVAGIHGQPYISWDEALQKGKTKTRGYCTHNSILFSTWHRPYLLLWEIKDEAKKLAKDPKYDYDTKAMLEAAKSWRFPYWDWALKKPGKRRGGKYDYNIPEVLRDKKVTITIPLKNGKRKLESVINAFYQFTMPGRITMGDGSLLPKKRKFDRDEDDSLKDSKIRPVEGINEDKQKYTVPYDKCIGTSRYPKGNRVSRAWVAGTQDNGKIVQQLRDYPTTLDERCRLGKLTAGLRDAVYRILTIDKFEDFATSRKPDGAPEQDFAFDSVESIHNNIHDWCGGPSTAVNQRNGDALEGHVSQVPVAAFDPIFWLHHYNIDRLIAIWQILHDDSWFVKNDERNFDKGNFYIETGHHDTPEDPLRPFHDECGKYFTSNSVREVTELGYTYKGLEKWLYKKNTGYKYDKRRHLADLRRSIRAVYGSAWSAAQKSDLSKDPNETAGLGLLSLNDYPRGPRDLIGVNDYVVDVVYDKFALRGRSYAIDIFIGKVPARPPYNFADTGTLVGQIVNFSSELPDPDAPGCGGCRIQQDKKVLSTGRVILTNALTTRWKEETVHGANGIQILRGMDPETVIEFLKDNLHWRVMSMGQEVDIAREMPSLKISFAVGKADHYVDDSKMSRFYDYRDAHAVTEGRPGGATQEDRIHWEQYDSGN